MDSYFSMPRIFFRTSSGTSRGGWGIEGVVDAGVELVEGADLGFEVFDDFPILGMGLSVLEVRASASREAAEEDVAEADGFKA